MTAVLERPAARSVPAAARQRRWRLRAGEQLALFTVVTAAYVAVAAVLVFRYGSFALDAQSRLANALDVVSSHQPHLAAVGFVWNPLPSLTEIPLVLLGRAFPPLLARGLGAPIMSALFMAGAAVGIRGILADRGAGRTARLTLPLLFAVTPMIVVYGADGMSEAFFAFFLVWTARALLRWVEHRRTGDLVSAGIALALAYLTRYEAAAAAVGVALLITAVHRPGLRPDALARRRLGLDLLLGVGPFAAAFTGWAVLSAVIVRSPFAQFSSAYGNSRQTGESRADIRAVTGQGSARALSYLGRQLLALEPLLAVVLVVAVLLAWRRRSLTSLVPLAVFGPVLAFEALAFLAGDTFGWLRFAIMEIPLAVTTLAVCVPVGPPPPGGGADRAVALGMRRALVWTGALALLAPALVTSAVVMGNPALAREEHAEIAAPLAGDRRQAHELSAERAAARAVDALDAPAGTVLTEGSDSVLLQLASARPAQFLSTTDVHYQRDLADPVRFGIRYLLVAQPAASFDSLDAAYPALWATGGGFGPLVASFPATTEHFRLYRITAASTPGAVG